MTPEEKYMLDRIAHYMTPAADPLVAAGVTPPYTAVEALLAATAMDPVRFAADRAARFAAAGTPTVATVKPSDGGPRTPWTLTTADVAVRDRLVAHAGRDPGAVTRDGVAAALGMSTGLVSRCPSWKAFPAARAKHAGRTVVLTDKLLAVIPDADAARADELAATIEEQAKEMARDDARRTRRHDGP